MSAETVERVSALDEPPLYECTECGGQRRTRLPNHEPDCPVITGGDR